MDELADGSSDKRHLLSLTLSCMLAGFDKSPAYQCLLLKYTYDTNERVCAGACVGGSTELL